MNNKMMIKYELSIEGQKQSLLNGGNGKQSQEIEITEITKDFLDIATINSNGSVILNIDWTTPDVTAIKVDFQIEKVDFPGYGNRKTLKKYLVRDSQKTPKFDSEQTANKLIQWFQINRKEYNQKKEELQKEVNQLNINFENELNQLKQESEKAYELYYQCEEETKKRKEEEEKEKKIEREQKEQEKLNWINEFGSDHLKKAVKLQYDCQRQYILERSKIEYPEFVIDFNNNAEWNERSNPSETAIDEVFNLVETGINAFVVWLTDYPSYNIDRYDDPYNDCDFEPCEAIVIANYLGKYNLVKY